MTKLAQTDLSIVFEHADFAVVDKPVGLAMHDAKDGIIARMRRQYPAHTWYLVHRLDTGTSGCLLLAKHKQAAAILSGLFARRSIQKYYLAISDKQPKKKQGLIKGDMKKARGGSLMLSKTLENPAVTQYFSRSIGPGLRVFLCKPHTGKTHQIRVALKSQGAPILGDARYGGTAAARMHLHSFALKFIYLNAPIEVTHLSPEDEAFKAKSLDSSWLTPWQLSWPTI